MSSAPWILLLVNIGAIANAWREERKLLGPVFLTPGIVLFGSLLSLQLPVLLGLIVYRFTTAETLAVYNLAILSLCGSYAVSLITFRRSRWKKNRRDDPAQVNGLPSRYLWLGCVASLLGYAVSVVSIYKYGISDALSGVEGYHNERLEGGDIFQQISEISQTIGAFLIIAWLSWGRRVSLRLGIVYGFGIVLGGALTFVSGGRAALFFVAAITFLTVGAMRRIRKLFLLPFVFVSSILVSTTLRRVEYLGDHASNRLIAYFGAEDIIFSKDTLNTAPGLFAVNIITYWSGSLNTFCLIWENKEIVKRGEGMYSVRLLNPIIGILNQSKAKERSDAYFWNSDLLASFYGAGNQWPTLFGYFILDWGAKGLWIGSVIYGGLLGLVVVHASERNGIRRFLFLNAAYLFSIVAFMMPLTAIRPFFITFIVLILIGIIIPKDRR